jgi:hypothetical protein
LKFELPVRNNSKFSQPQLEWVINFIISNDKCLIAKDIVGKDFVILYYGELISEGHFRAGAPKFSCMGTFLIK